MGITPDFDINVALNEITSKEFDHCDYDKFNECLEAAQNIMILGVVQHFDTGLKSKLKSQ
jgi:hypothetical protein